MFADPRLGGRGVEHGGFKPNIGETLAWQPNGPPECSSPEKGQHAADTVVTGASRFMWTELSSASP